MRVQGRINKLGLMQKFGKEEAVEALQAAEAVVKSERALGQVILSAGYKGEIKVHLSAPNSVRSFLACTLKSKSYLRASSALGPLVYTCVQVLQALLTNLACI